MLHHAARVSKRALPHTLSPEPTNTRPGSPFTTILQVAAARAWTRTVVRKRRNVSTSASVTLGGENTARTKGPLSGVPSESDTGSWLGGQQFPPFACVGYLLHCIGDVLTRIQCPEFLIGVG